MTPLHQQLEDKKKGCFRNWNYNNKKGYCHDTFLCPICQAEIAILEQAIAEIQKQRQEILDKIDLYLMVTKGNYECQKALEELKQQLNQPKTEK